MKVLKLISSIIAVLFGVFIIVYGGIDDSPGAQLLGLLVVITGIVGAIMSRKRSLDKSRSNTFS